MRSGRPYTEKNLSQKAIINDIIIHPKANNSGSTLKLTNLNQLKPNNILNTLFQIVRNDQTQLYFVLLEREKT